jgi:hypothetical protein
MKVWYVTSPLDSLETHRPVYIYRNHSRKKLTLVQPQLLPPRPPRATPYQLARNMRCLSPHSVETTHRRTFESVCSHQSPMRLSALHRLAAPDLAPNRPAQSCPRSPFSSHSRFEFESWTLSLPLDSTLPYSTVLSTCTSCPNLVGQITKNHGLCSNTRPTRCRPGTTARPQAAPMFDLLDDL